MVRIGAIEFQAGFKRYAVCESAFYTLLYRVTGRIDEIVNKLQYKLVSCVCDREIFRECLVKSLVFSFVRFCFELEKILERFYLYVKKIGVRHRIFYRSKTDPLRINSLSQWNLFLIKSKMKKRTKGLRPRQVRKPPGLSLF